MMKMNIGRLRRIAIRQFEGVVVCDAMPNLENIPKLCKFKAFENIVA